MRWLNTGVVPSTTQNTKRQESRYLRQAAVIGADPATILAAVAPVPDTMSEYQFAGLLRNQKVELVDVRPCLSRFRHSRKSFSRGMSLSANMGMRDHMEITQAITTRWNNSGLHPLRYNHAERPIYLSTFTGRPPDEPSVLGEALNELFIPLLIQQFPEIVDFWLPEGCSFIGSPSSPSRRPIRVMPKRVMMAVWSYLRQFLYTKMVIVVDDDIDCAWIGQMSSGPCPHGPGP